MRSTLLHLMLPIVALFVTKARSDAAPNTTRPAGPVVLMVSIDGMRADYLSDADRYKLRIPVLRGLIRTGATARRMITIFPSVTYPAHVSLLTGEPPARHGIPDNERFEPLVDRQADWHWFAREIQTPTLLSAARCGGLRTAAVGWPVTVGAPADDLLPELWENNDFNNTFVSRSRGAATPGLIEAAEQEFGFTFGMEHIEEQKAKIARFIVRHHQPDLLLVHFDEVDKMQHQKGPRAPEALAALEELDQLVGEIIEEYRHAGLSDRLITCIVSDHGFERVERMFKPNVVLRQVGLIDYDEQNRCITGWRAKAWVSGASASLMLADPTDRASYERARQALSQYSGKADSPIGRFLERTDIQRLGANPQAAFMFDSGSGYMYSRGASGEPIETAPIHGMHGQMPDRPQLAASFILSGGAVPRGLVLEQVSILSVAPTIARLAHIPFGETTGKPITAILPDR